MQTPFSLWYVDGDSLIKRYARIEILGKTFLLYENEWRSGPYYFGDLVYKGRKGESETFGLEDGIKDRPKWRIGIKGEMPPELSKCLPKRKKPVLSGAGMWIVAFLCLAIVYFVGTQ